MTHDFRQSDLEAYLDEALPAAEMARIEKSLREDSALTKQLAAIHSRRGAGAHSVGEIWRRHRLSCPTREQLGSFLLGVLPDDVAQYITFHVDVAGCRFCQSNLADLRSRQAETHPTTEVRRRKFFQSSAGYLKGKRK